MKLFTVSMLVAGVLGLALVALSWSPQGRDLLTQCMNNSGTIGWQAK